MAGNGKKYFEADTFERIRKRILMIDPVKKSRKHNARAICIYLKKKKIYIYLSKIKVTWNFFHAASRRFIGKIGCIGKLCKEYGTSNAE